MEVTKAEKVKVSIEMPLEMKIAAEQEAARRGMNLSVMVRHYLSSFLPENIEKSILQARAGR